MVTIHDAPPDTVKISLDEGNVLSLNVEHKPAEEGIFGP